MKQTNGWFRYTQIALYDFLRIVVTVSANSGQVAIRIQDMAGGEMIAVGSCLLINKPIFYNDFKMMCWFVYIEFIGSNCELTKIKQVSDIRNVFIYSLSHFIRAAIVFPKSQKGHCDQASRLK